jgi:hypothetical protein
MSFDKRYGHQPVRVDGDFETWLIPRHSQGLVFPGKRDSTIFLLFLSTSIT